MDMKNDATIPYCGSLPRLAGASYVVGAKQIRKALQNGRAKRVYLALNADPAVTGPLEALCRQHNVPLTWVRSMQDLGRTCHIEVSASAAAVVD